MLHPVPSKEWQNVPCFPRAKRRASALTSRLMMATLRSTPRDLYPPPLLQTLRSALKCSRTERRIGTLYSPRKCLKSKRLLFSLPVESGGHFAILCPQQDTTIQILLHLWDDYSCHKSVPASILLNVQYKDLARLLPARSLRLRAVKVHRTGVRELSGPTKAVTEAACCPIPEGRNGGKVELTNFV